MMMNQISLYPEFLAFFHFWFPKKGEKGAERCVCVLRGTDVTHNNTRATKKLRVPSRRYVMTNTINLSRLDLDHLDLRRDLDLLDLCRRHRLSRRLCLDTVLSAPLSSRSPLSLTE